jgi:multiple sugar transport system ATP-binding protein
MAVLTLDHVSKRYSLGDELAVDDVSFTVADGEFMVLLGPSGCGKSTTLRMIAGLEAVTSGTLSIDDRIMNMVPAKDRDIAMVFQSYALYPHMSARDNLAFGLKRRHVPKVERERRVADVAEMLGLTPYLARRPHALSGGQRQRVALGRAIVRNPKVFLFDEPLSNLDAALRVSTRNELIKLHQRLGATMVYVTHDQVEAMTMGTRICIMNKGRLVQVGPPLDVYRNPADTFVARFLGNPPMNLLAGIVADGNPGPHVRIGSTEVPFPPRADPKRCPAKGERVVLGIRPEDLYERAPTDESARHVPIVASVVAVEPLGAETLVTVRPSGCEEEMIVRGGRSSQLRAGDQPTLWLDVSATHLFDATEGITLDRS